jgi:hypothetical protein
MVRFVIRLCAVAAVVIATSTAAWAQGTSTTSITGIVQDAQGGAVPGATVVIKNNGTNAVINTVSNEQGTFTANSIDPGTYTVTVSLMGFKTAVLNDVVVTAQVPANVRARLEVGGLEEMVVVTGASEIVQTTASAVSTTLNLTQISNLPLTSRNALDFITFLPGVNTPGGNRDSTVNGLPQSAINLTVDGMSVQDNHLKTGDGFFARMSPRLDAVESVTVTTAANGADASGQGAVQVRFTTRSGTNTFSGSAYHYFRHHSLNTNTWFNIRDNIAKAELVQNQPGIRLGGPIVIPGLFNGRNKAFFFGNWEELRQPSDVTRTRTILNPRAEQGWFRYNVTSGGVTTVREVNVLTLAGGSIDPRIGKILSDIRTAVGTTGTITDQADPRLQSYTFNVATQAHNIYPTVKIDYNLNDAHRLTGSFNYNHILSTPDTTNGREPMFPGFPVTGVQDSDRYTTKLSLKSTLSANVVNEFAIGGTGGATLFSPGLNASMWSGTPVADQGGFQLAISAAGITNASSAPSPSSREASTKMIENTTSWMRGNHSLTFGGNWTQVDIWVKDQTLVPTINFDVITGDPALGLFTTANFPGASAANVTAARALYATLTGRVSSINSNARIDENTNKYVYSGEGIQRGRMREMDFFVQDNWRVRPNLSLNLGVRYALQLPFISRNDSYSMATVADAWGVSGLAAGCDPSAPKRDTCNLFKPGTQTGSKPVFTQFDSGTRAYNIDWNNVAPSIGFNWSPTGADGLLRAITGESGFSIRGGVARAYSRNGTSDFTGVFGANPGVAITTNRSLTLGNLNDGAGLPLLLSQTSRLGAPAFPETKVYPMSPTVDGSVNTFDPNLQVAYSDSWTLGVQRSISKNMAVEVRYVGTRARDLWTTYNYNGEVNIIENGYLDEFKLAQANLQANIAAGRGSTFRYFGAGTGTSPLPIHLAYFSGVSAANAGDASRYTSSFFTNTTFVNPLAIRNPNPSGAANALDADATRRSNALLAGLPANFLVPNPDALGGANVTGNGGYTRYNSMQVELRRRLSGGLQFDASYVFGRGYESVRYSFRRDRVLVRDTGGEGDVAHAFKSTFVYELPFGRGQRFASNAGSVLDRIVGGWQVQGTVRLQSGRMVDFGNVRMVGFDIDELRDMYKLRIDENQRVSMLPQAVIDETIKAFSVNATSATGYGSLGAPSGKYFAPANGPDCIETAGNFGDCGARTVVVRGEMFKNVDISVAKIVPIKGRVRGEFRFEVLNLFNAINFTPVASTSTNATAHEVTGGGAVRFIQLVSRISW